MTRALPYLRMTLAMLLGLIVAAPGVAQYAKDTVTYQITNVVGAGSRSAIAATGADIFEVGHDYVLLETQDQFENLFPPADSNYHDYAEMVAERAGSALAFQQPANSET